MKIISRTVPFSTPWFELVAKTTDASDSPFYSLRMLDYVSTVAITENNDIVFVRQYRPAVERVTLELPGGHVDPGETPAIAAARELLEETGFRTSGEVTILGSLVPDTGRLENRMWCCFARGVRPPSPEFAPEAGVEVVRRPCQEVASLIRDGVFDHALHLAIVLMALTKVDRGMFGFS